ncbi:plastocyanin [Mycolicibacterium chubuense NBB4]|uniref:Plastocyanin n=1 Tax=Mycolicibacterium chubuense (strain NBB4) TaxID=710421 RepID=I4BFV9_MYCCN|nr:plastocyanin [Mycolicibacterium chubuense NBB4]
MLCRTTFLISLATAGTAALVAGCSAGADTVAAPSVTFPPGSATPGMAGMSGMPDMPDMPGMPAHPPSAPAAPPSGPDAVDITNFAFTPATLTVPVGATVTWTNRDEEPHTVAAGDGTFHSPGMGTNATYTFTFTRAGSFGYVCSIHPFMHGTVVVTG